MPTGFRFRGGRGAGAPRVTAGAGPRSAEQAAEVCDSSPPAPPVGRQALDRHRSLVVAQSDSIGTTSSIGPSAPPREPDPSRWATSSTRRETSIRSSASATERSSSPASRRPLTSAVGGLGRHAGRERLPGGAGEHGERARHGVGSGRRRRPAARRAGGRAEDPARSASGPAAMRSAIWQRCSPWLTSSSGPSGAGAANCGCARGGVDRRRVAVEEQRLDRHHVALDGERAEQELGEAPGLLGIGLGASLLGDVPGDAGQRERRGGHDLVDARRRREQAGEVADGELDRRRGSRAGAPARPARPVRGATACAG